MGYCFFGSVNTKYCLIKKNDKISLMKEESLIWENSVAGLNMTDAEIANSGAVLIHAENMCYLVLPGSSRLSPLGDFDYDKLFPVKGRRMRLSEDGSKIAYIKYDVKKNRSIFAKLTTSKAPDGSERNPVEYELIIEDLASRKQRQIYKVSSYTNLSDYFIWDISSDFLQVILSVPKQSGNSIELSIYNLNLKVSADKMRKIPLKDAKILDVALHKIGAWGIRVLKKEIEAFLIMDRNSDIYQIPVASSEKFFYLGRGFFILESIGDKGERVFTVKQFNGTTTASYSMDIFKEHGIEFELLFNDKDMLNLVYYLGDKFYSYPADVVNLLTELRRVDILLKTDASQRNSFSNGAAYFMDYFEAPNLDEMEKLEEDVRDSQLSGNSLQQRQQDHMHETSQNAFSALAFQTASRNIKAGVSKQKVLKVELKLPEIPKEESSLKSGSDIQIKPGRFNLDLSLETESEKSPKAADRPVLSLDFSNSSAFTRASGNSIPLDGENSDGATGDDSSYRPKAAEKKFDASDLPADKPTESPAASSVRDSEIRKLEKLLESIEDRYLLGEINEDSYKDLKSKYTRQLNAKKNKDIV